MFLYEKKIKKTIISSLTFQPLVILEKSTKFIQKLPTKTFK